MKVIWQQQAYQGSSGITISFHAPESKQKIAAPVTSKAKLIGVKCQQELVFAYFAEMETLQTSNKQR